VADGPASIREAGILITPVAADDERLALLQQRGTPVALVDSRSRAGSKHVARRSSQARPGPAG
jgi:DNA-binding LacI/PurR family transcriptional regulator